MGVEPGTVATKDVEEKKFSGKGVGGDVGFAEEMNTLPEGGADVEGLGLRSGHGLSSGREFNAETLRGAEK
jgi:hypothetical protein